MCMNCGCGEPEMRHKDTDITLEDIRQAAEGSTMEETVQNLRASLDQVPTGQAAGSAQPTR